MPHALELPRMRGAVVPLVGAGCSVVDKFVADGFPRLPAVVRALNHLPEPSGGLRAIQTVRIRGRPLQVIDLPAREMGPADVPLFPLAVRRQHEGPLACADQYAYSAHPSPLPERPIHIWRRAPPLYCRSAPAQIDSQRADFTPLFEGTPNLSQSVTRRTWRGVVGLEQREPVNLAGRAWPASVPLTTTA
jgi:hypothetical protein